MKLKGIIKEFDGYNGIIITNDNKEFIFNKNNYNENIQINDKVIFIPELFETVEIKKMIATFIKKIN